MGSHLSYAEVPTAEPSGRASENDGAARIGVSYIFSTDDDDEVVDDHQEESPPPVEFESAVYHMSICVYERSDLRTHPAEILLTRCKPGDLLEFVSSNQSPHWCVYIGHFQVVHLHRLEIKCSLVTDAGRDRRCRIVNQLYKFEPLSSDMVVRNATNHVGVKNQQLCWRNSECFAAWCRFGRREFKTGGELRIGKQPYKLNLTVTGKQVRTLEFQSLDDVIMERRHREKGGRLSLQNELAEHWSGDGDIREEPQDPLGPQP